MITAQDKEIQALVNDIRDGRLLLPEMQRSYVWKGPQVRDLFDSLYHNYPSGQLLVWETDDLPHTRQVSVDELDKPQRRPQLLLDGQQRLTSLSAVMLGKPLHVQNVKRPIDIVFNVHTEKFEVAGPRQTGDAGWISLTKLFNENMFSIMRDLGIDMNSADANIVHERLARLTNIKTYKYRMIVLENISYEEVTSIFVRINSGGTTLGSADLALAQISSRWPGVTDVFSKYQWSLWNKHTLWLDNGLLLRTISLLLTGQSRLNQFFRGDHKKITVEELQQAWKRTHQGLDQAIDFLINNCKIDRLNLLSTNNILPPLAAFFDRFGANVSPEQARDLQRWAYMALTWQRYSAATETALDQDYAALSKEQPVLALIQNVEDKAGHNRRVTERELRDQRKNSPYLVMSYVLSRYADAEDWFNGTKIGASQTMELHHVFPKAVLKEQYDLKADSRTVDQVANLAFLSKRANSKIAASSPADYLPTLPEARLRSQYVPLDPALWQPQRFEDFALRRRELLAEGINKLLLSLTDRPPLYPSSTIEFLETRIETLEHQFRDLVAERLIEAYGDAALERGVPKDVRRSLEFRRGQRLDKNPFEADQFSTVHGLLQFCQFSDYAKILREQWPLFGGLFGKGESFDQHVRAATTVRNAFAHNNTLSQSDLLSGEAGLVWLEDCLRALEQPDDDETIGDDGEAVAVGSDAASFIPGAERASMPLVAGNQRPDRAAGEGANKA